MTSCTLESAPELTQEQAEEMKRVKGWFPYRIVFGVLRKTGEFEVWAKPTMHAANKLNREGHTIWLLK
jgi:hypothetical protein